MAKHVFTIDLEEWFCSHNLLPSIGFEDWASKEERVRRSTFKIIDLLEKHNIKATFFVLGWIAERYPLLIEEIYHYGHEVGSHGYGHQLLTTMNADLFNQDLKKSIRLLEEICKTNITAYRAPAFSIDNKNHWAYDVMKKNNINVDSSVYPLAYHPDYGISDASLQPYKTDNGILEVPMSCVEICNIKVPCSGGGYFRLLPYKIYSKLIEKLTKQGRSLIFYLHPWEIDPDIPKVNLPRMARLRHYSNLDTTFKKLNHLLNDFEFTSMENYLADDNLIKKLRA